LEIGDFTGFAKVETVIMDASYSDIPDDTKHEVYVPAHCDGFGKDQKEAYDFLKNHFNEMIRENLPSEFNIVLFSMAGATGANIGLGMIEAILKQGKPVVGVAICAMECERTTTNTRNTIKRLEVIVNRTQKPVVISFHDNGEFPMSVVNDHIIQEIKALLLLNSGQNTGIDTEDVTNLIDFRGVTKFEPGLVDLIITTKPDQVKVNVAIAALSLYNDLDSPKLDITSIYSGFGIIPDGAQGATKEPIPEAHFIVTNEYLESRLDLLDKKVKDYTDARELIKGCAGPRNTNTEFEF
jgi:hypothetical protein